MYFDLGTTRPGYTGRTAEQHATASERRTKPGYKVTDARGGVVRRSVRLADGTMATSDSRGRPLFDYCKAAKVPEHLMKQCEDLLTPLSQKHQTSSSELTKAAETFAKESKAAMKAAEEQAAANAQAAAFTGQRRRQYMTYAIAIGGAVALGLLLTRKKKPS